MNLRRQFRDWILNHAGTINGNEDSGYCMK